LLILRISEYFMTCLSSVWCKSFEIVGKLVCSCIVWVDDSMCYAVDKQPSCPSQIALKVACKCRLLRSLCMPTWLVWRLLGAHWGFSRVSRVSRMSRVRIGVSVGVVWITESCYINAAVKYKCTWIWQVRLLTQMTSLLTSQRDYDDVTTRRCARAVDDVRCLTLI